MYLFWRYGRAKEIADHVKAERTGVIQQLDLGVTQPHTAIDESGLAVVRMEFVGDNTDAAKATLTGDALAVHTHGHLPEDMAIPKFDGLIIATTPDHEQAAAATEHIVSRGYFESGQITLSGLQICGK